MANAPTVRGSQNGTSNSKVSSFAPVVNTLTTKNGNYNKVAPGGSGGLKASLDLNELDNYYNLNDTTPDRGRNHHNSSSLSLRSSFDYMDLNLNEGLHLEKRSGNKTHRNLPQKVFMEDATPDGGNFSGDESV